MPRNFVQQAFGVWLEKNRERFEHRPTQIRYVRGDVHFFFTDVIHEISAVINKHGCNIAFTYQNELWDFLVCFDISVERDRDGYYCGHCIAEDGNIEKRFASRTELLVGHVLEPLLQWSNEQLCKGVVAKIYQVKKGGSTWVNLVSNKKFEINEESGQAREGFPPDVQNMVRAMNIVQRRKINRADYYFSFENICLRWLGL